MRSIARLSLSLVLGLLGACGGDGTPAGFVRSDDVADSDGRADIGELREDDPPSDHATDAVETEPSDLRDDGPEVPGDVGDAADLGPPDGSADVPDDALPEAGDEGASDVPAGDATAEDSDGAAGDVSDAQDLPGDTGTDDAPGEDLADDGTIDWCRLQGPESAEAVVGTALLFVGRVRVAGLTDITTGVDPEPGLVAAVGIGPAGTTPDPTWTWTAAVPRATWDDAAEPGVDEYIATLTPAATGTFDVAFRFQRARGTPALCDRWVAAGSDGSEDGYATVAAGRLRVIRPCDAPGVCPEPPPATCLGETTQVAFGAAECDDGDGTAACAHPPVETACAARHVCLGGACVPDFVEISGCRLQWPAALEVAPGAAFDATMRVRAAGVTDRTPAVDASPLIRVELGVGADSDPATWAWGAAEADPDWDGAAAGAPAWDTYRGVIDAPATEGVYGFAARVSGDRGASWTYCDLNVGPGADGAEDGFARTDAGRLEVVRVVDPCDPNPCVGEPAPRCDGDQLVESATRGSCSIAGEAAECAYGDVLIEDCGVLGFACAVDRCASGLTRPVAGEVAFTEVAPLPRSGTPGWVELVNVGDRAFDLDGCRFVSPGAAIAVSRPLVVPAGARLLVAASSDATALGATPDFVFSSIVLGAPGFIYLECDGTTVDTAWWLEGDVIEAVAFQLSSSHTSGSDNDWPIHWCSAEDVYAAGLGTPRGANRACPDLSASVDWCALQWPLSGTLAEGEPFSVYGRLYSAGLTDRTDGVDADSWVVGQGGIGSGTPDDTWTWVDAAPNAAWSGTTAGAPNDDEYQVTLAAPPAAGSPYTTAFRFSGDGGAHWTICDRRGSVDVVPPADACVPNPCMSPPVGTCAGQVGRRVETAGTCVEGGASCDFDYVEQDCAPAGGICVGGYCPGAPPVEIGWCRLQWPRSMTLSAGSTETVYGRYWVSGLTDTSPGNDHYPSVRGQLGWGRAGVDPRAAPLAYTWVDATPNPSWYAPAAGEPANDELQATLTAPASGSYAYAFRFSGDGGASWIVCDGQSTGTADGFQMDNLGALTVP